MESRFKYLGQNTIIFTISSFATKIVSFFLLPLYTNVLSTAEYGSADIIATTAYLLLYILTLNIADAVIRYSLNNQEPEEIISYGIRILFWGSVICFLGLSVIYCLNILGWPQFYYIMLFCTFFSSALYSIVSGYLRGTERIATVGISAVVSSVTTIILNVLFLTVLHLGIGGYLYSLFLGPLVASIYGLIACKLPIRTFIFCKCDTKLRKQMRQYSIPLIFSGIALWVNNYLDRFFIVSICGPDQNGIYSVANKIPTILATVFSVFTQAWGLSAIKDIDSENSNDFFSRVYDYYITVIILFCSVLILCNVSLSLLLFRKDFFEAWQYSTVLLLAISINALTSFWGAFFSAAKKTRAIATTTILAAIINTFLNAILIPLLGVLGAAIATCVSYVVMLITRIILSRRVIYLKTHFFRDISAFVVISLQVVFDHFENHFYAGQVFCLVLVFILYFHSIKDLWRNGIIQLKTYVLSRRSAI